MKFYSACFLFSFGKHKQREDLWAISLICLHHFHIEVRSCRFAAMFCRVELGFVSALAISLVFTALVAFAPKKKSTFSKERLGKMLFFDPILSADSSVSCASCHKPDFAYADTIAFSYSNFCHTVKIF